LNVNLTWQGEANWD